MIELYGGNSAAVGKDKIDFDFERKAETDSGGESGLFDVEIAGNSPCFSTFGIDQDRQRSTHCY
jgi:hypothetical protein